MTIFCVARFELIYITLLFSYLLTFCTRVADIDLITITTSPSGPRFTELCSALRVFIRILKTIVHKACFFASSMRYRLRVHSKMKESALN